VQAAALVSAYPIIAVDLHDEKLALAKEMGATHIINGKTQDVRAEILSILKRKCLMYLLITPACRDYRTWL